MRTRRRQVRFVFRFPCPSASMLPLAIAPSGSSKQSTFMTPCLVVFPQGHGEQAETGTDQRTRSVSTAPCLLFLFPLRCASADCSPGWPHGALPPFQPRSGQEDQGNAHNPPLLCANPLCPRFLEEQRGCLGHVQNNKCPAPLLTRMSIQWGSQDVHFLLSHVCFRGPQDCLCPCARTWVASWRACLCSRTWVVS